MKIVILGSGNVASVLSRKLKNGGHEIIQVYSRNAAHAEQLATELNTAFTDDWSLIEPQAEVYIFALNDTVLAEATKKLGYKEGLVIHTAGTLPKSILSQCADQYGILYPLQSLRKEKSDYSNIPILVDGSTPESLRQVEVLAYSCSPAVQKADDTERLHLHLAAVLVSNFTNHLYSLAAGYCRDNHVDFRMLQPLIEETALRLRKYNPGDVQTGPAVRKDHLIIEKHIQLLKSNPLLQQLYQMLTHSIQQCNNKQG